MTTPLNSFYSKLYTETLDFNQDGIPDLLTVTEQEGFIQAYVEMNGYSDPSGQNRIILSQQNKCDSKYFKEKEFSNFCSNNLFKEAPTYSSSHQNNLSPFFSNIFQGASCFLQLECPKEEVKLVSPLLQCMEEKDRLTEINRSDLEILPASYECQETFEMVRQRAAVILDPKKNTDRSLYTFFATNCLILMVAAKDSQNKTIRIGMAHVDNTVNRDGIRKFFDQFTAGIKETKIEVSVISGIEETALNTLTVIDERGYLIKFFNVDLDQSRNDAALIDSRGKIYYGLKELITGCRFGALKNLSRDDCSFMFRGDPRTPNNGDLAVTYFPNSNIE